MDVQSSDPYRRLQQLKDRLQLHKEDELHMQESLQAEEQELAAREEQLKLVRQRVAQTREQLHQLRSFAHFDPSVQQSTQIEKEDAEMRGVFSDVLEDAITQRIRSAQWRAMDSEETEDKETVKEVYVMFELEEAVFRVNDTYTFEALLEDCCRYFERDPSEVKLVDERDEPWGADSLVRTELAKLENMYGRVLLKQEEQVYEEEEREPNDMAELLMGMEEEEEEDEDEDEGAAELAALAVHDAEAEAELQRQRQAKKKKKKVDRKQLLKELPSFVVFSVLFLLALQTRRVVSDANSQVTAIRTALVDEAFGDFNEKTMEDIATWAEVFDWLEGVFVPGVFPDEKYNGDQITREDLGAVMGFNRIVGTIRFRQLRSQPDVGCVPIDLNERLRRRATDGVIYTEEFIPDCYQSLTKENEAKQAYGPALELLEQYGSCANITRPGDEGAMLAEIGDAGVLERMTKRNLCGMFTYTSNDDFHTAGQEKGSVKGKLGVPYQGGGYVRDVANPIDCREQEGVTPAGLCRRSLMGKQDLSLAIEQMKSNRWLDAATRALLIKVGFYNANVDAYVSSTFVFDFTLGGVVLPKVHFGTLRTISFDLQREPILFISDMGVYIIVLYYTLSQMNIFQKTVRKTGSLYHYFNDIWNLVELSVLTLFYASVATRVRFFSSLYPDPMIFEPYFIDYQYVTAQYALSFNLDAVCVLALFFKFFKFAQLNTDMNMLWSVLTLSSLDILFFVFLLLNLLFAFGMMAEQMLGTMSREYMDIGQALTSLFLILLGQFDLPQMVQANPLFGFSFFLIYVVVMFFILMNIFLAILGAAYTVTRAEAQEKKARMAKVKRRSLREWLVYVVKFVKKRAQERSRKAQLAAATKEAEKVS